MSFLLRVVERVLVDVLTVRSTPLGRRRSKGDPFVVQHRPFQRISTRTCEIDFLFTSSQSWSCRDSDKTHRVGKLAITRTKRLHEMQLDLRSLQNGLVVDNPVLSLDPTILDRIPSDEVLERSHEIVVPADKQQTLLQQRRNVDDFLSKQIEQLEKLGVGRSIVEVLFDAIKEAKLFALHECRRAMIGEIRIVGGLHSGSAGESGRRSSVRLRVLIGGLYRFVILTVEIRISVDFWEERSSDGRRVDDLRMRRLGFLRLSYRSALACSKYEKTNLGSFAHTGSSSLLLFLDRVFLCRVGLCRSLLASSAVGRNNHRRGSCRIGRIGKESFEFVEEIWRGVKQGGDLGVHLWRG